MNDGLARWVDGLAAGRTGWLAQRKREREVFGIPAQGPETHWAKRGWGSKRREIRCEAANARVLAEMGLGPPVVAAGAHGDSEWIVTEDAGTECLAVSRGGITDTKARRRVLAVVAAAARRLHDAGLAFPDLTARHTFLRADGAWFIDPARLERLRGPAPVALRARDLAALLASLNWPAIPRPERVRLLRDATGETGDGLCRLCTLVAERISVLASRTRWRHAHLDATVRFQEAFTLARFAAGAGSVSMPDDVFERGTMRVVRTLSDRENRTLGTGPDGRPLFFVKAFPPTRRGESPAMAEIAAIDRFQRAGIPVNRVAAYAEDVDRGSFVAVVACDGEPLDDLLRRGVTPEERRALAVQSARIWRRMRDCGLRHRDAYPCHLFAARTDTSNRFELRLIDLTRAGLATWPKRRWFVKDAAALWHGCPKPPVTRTDAVRWLREYFRVPKLTAEAKRFARAVSAKEASIAARQERKARKACADGTQAAQP
ncbi:MAG: hypothetical protein K8T90_07270 [Planctomycetes bacterium]|nr:hypothetical protein [Planctomycetota bacterium]